MQTFVYRGVGESGEIEEGTLEADNEALAFDILQSRGLTVFELGKQAAGYATQKPWYLRDILIKTDRLDPNTEAKYAELLACLFDAHLPATEALRIVALTAEAKGARRQLQRTLQRVQDGQSLGEAFEAENTCFSPMFSTFLKLSDVTNRLPPILRSLAEIFRKQGELQRKLTTALIYPAILVLAAICLIFVVIFVLAPNLEPIFSSAGQVPPPILRGLLKVNTLLQNHGIWIGVIGIIVLLGLALTLQSQSGRNLYLKLLEGLPFVGPIRRTARLIRLVAATEMLLSSGQSLAESLRQAGILLGQGSEMGTSFQDAALAIEAGSNGADVFEKATQFPTVFKELYRVGEATNSLPDTLKAVVAALESDLENHLQKVMAILTPALTLVMGVGIGLLIYTLMSALLEVNNLAF